MDLRGAYIDPLWVGDTFSHPPVCFEFAQMQPARKTNDIKTIEDDGNELSRKAVKAFIGPHRMIGWWLHMLLSYSLIVLESIFRLYYQGHVMLHVLIKFAEYMLHTNDTTTHAQLLSLVLSV